MPNRIIPRRSFTPNSVPVPSTDISAAGELLINWADKVAYSKDSSGNLITVPLGGSGGGSSYTLPTASASVLGGIKIGSGLSIDGNGVVTASGGGGGGGGSASIVSAATVAGFPATGSASNLYVATDTRRIYGWDASGVYVELGPTGAAGVDLSSYFVPPAPTGLTATAGNAQVALSWTAPSATHIPPITDYVVQFSSDSGSTWATFSDGTSTATSATVTGLTNGTAYAFRVAAVNGVGTGSPTAASASVTPVAFSPSSIGGLQLWLDASDASTLYDATSGGSLVAADGAVARWEDKSGNGRHFTQATSASRPVRKPSQQNGRDTLLFAAGSGASRGDDILIGSDFGDYLQSGQSATVFVVLKTLTSGVRHEIINKQDALGGWRFLVEGDDKATLFFDQDNGNRTTVATTGTVSTSSYSVLAFKASGGSLSSAAIYYNGTSLAVSASGSVQSVADNSAAIEIGGATSAGIVYDSLDGNIAEIIVYNSALSDTDRAAVEQYLMTKWGVV